MEFSKRNIMDYILSNILLFYLWELPFATCETGVYTFEAIQHGKSIDGVQPVHTYMTTFSKIHCATMCARHAECSSFTMDCTAVERGDTSACYIYDQYVTDVTALVTSPLCFIQKKIEATTTLPPTTTTATTTLPPTTTTTTATTTLPPTTPTTTPYQSQVIDIVYGAMDMCSTSPSSQKDFLVLTLGGVYIFDTFADLTTAPCTGPLSLATVFSGYGSNLPAIAAVDGVLSYQNLIELYSDGWVYIWTVNSGALVKQTARQTYEAYLGVAAGSPLLTAVVQWAAYRSKFDAERHYYLGGNEFFIRTNQNVRQAYMKTDPVYNINGFNMNPWGDIPDTTIAVCGYTDQPMTNFVAIDSLNNVYSYELIHSPDNNNPTKTLTLQSKLVFA